MDRQEEKDPPGEVKRDENEAEIKPEYVITDHQRQLVLDCVSETDKRKLKDGDDEDEGAKKQKLTGREQRKIKGQNKSRRKTAYREDDADVFCNNIIKTGSCDLPVCKYTHDTVGYLAKKAPDIGPECYVYSLRGFCPRGITCRFGSSHLTEDGINIKDEILYQKSQDDGSWKTLNSMSNDLKMVLRKKKYDFSKSASVVKEVDRILGRGQGMDANGENLGPVDDTDVIKLRPEEKKQIDWRDKLYLSPLTTLGNLPFRRICKEYGADVTCGEMALASELLQGSPQEWALVKRHPSEDLFGVQIAGTNMPILTRCAQLVDENAKVDFVDINMGCPIDLIYRQGGGSAMLRSRSQVRSVVNGVSRVLSVPLTVKVRTGVTAKNFVSHKYMADMRQAGVSLVTVHGRSREQRFVRKADWEYIETCAKEASPMAVFGNGDILSYRDYELARERSPTAQGVMIGRGALMKPWIFTEIKEKRNIDMTSSQRFEILGKFVNYGLEHWGSDTRGVEITRRFLLEWLSFLYRYIPVGILVNPPQVMNARPPYYRGRDEMETLMASGNCSDWIKISEMLLNKVPEGFTFLPKHKANAWS
ncbi:tRNA-dihydrouridine(47) synthase [NAD(P)(+)]-like isoform X2 [Cimex lectularius]|uniref:tRNA-dihydrouridine(47) synthase [NAD(P)(+)] n=1 Tax=Cimex lectularius TaxID=79782 RepID=A0A8I6S668_CIMLE|nr:tRNA-dihydrouridine(47) synthase [NAD(P)(+)]-like isoform X2 [Cimex lectularius]